MDIILPDSISEMMEKKFIPMSEELPILTHSATKEAQSSRSFMHEMPSVPHSKMQREFELDFPGVEITSLDITSHGCYVLAGCSNGMIILFDLTNSGRGSYLVGHIHARGMHTNLLLNVKITEDCRFGFVGVLKGSMEMLVVDLGRLPMWRAQSTPSSKKKADVDVKSLVSSYAHSDSKLRGFGNVTRLVIPSGNLDGASAAQDTYILVCGRGIKNIHIWSFVPPVMDANGWPVNLDDKPTWNCLYDVPTNGNSIEFMGFREGGIQMMSKSHGMCVRVWDLSNAFTPSASGKSSPSIEEKTDMGTETDDGSESPSSSKLSYEDIPNSQDVRSFCDGFGFGGTYNFEVVRLDAPKWANKESFDIPARLLEDDNGQRKRRLMRQIDQVIGTQDGSHVIALCTDGGVLHFSTRASQPPLMASLGPSKDEEDSSDLNGPPVSTGLVIEFSQLKRDPELDSAWCLKRVGAEGRVVLLRSIKSMTPGLCQSVDVNILSDLVQEISPESSVLPADSLRWYRGVNSGCCYSSYVATVADEEPSDVMLPLPPKGKSADSPRGRPPTTSSSSKKSSQPAMTPGSIKTSQAQSNITPTVSVIQSGPIEVPKIIKRSNIHVRRPVASSTPNKALISSCNISTPTLEVPLALEVDESANPYKRMYASVIPKQAAIVPTTVVKERRLEPPVMTLVTSIGPPPKVDRRPAVTVADSLSRNIGSIAFEKRCLNQFYVVRDVWIKAQEYYKDPSHVPAWCNFPTMSQSLGSNLLKEQSRLKAQYCSDISQAATKEISDFLTYQSDSDGKIDNTIFKTLRLCLELVTKSYQELVGEILVRQQMEVRASLAVNPISKLSGSNADEYFSRSFAMMPPWRFAYPDMLLDSKRFETDTIDLIKKWQDEIKNV